MRALYKRTYSQTPGNGLFPKHIQRLMCIEGCNCISLTGNKSFPTVLFQEYCTLKYTFALSQTCTQSFCINLAGKVRERRKLVPHIFYFCYKQCHCFDIFTQNISLRNLLKMVLLHSHSRVGGNNRAYFEPETIYIVTVGSVPSQPLGVEPHR